MGKKSNRKQPTLRQLEKWEMYATLEYAKVLIDGLKAEEMIKQEGVMQRALAWQFLCQKGGFCGRLYQVTITSLRRKYPRLICQAEKSLRLKFKRKPTLRFTPGGRPREDSFREVDGHGKIVRITVARIMIPKRMAKQSPRLAELAALHELRESLLFQNGYSMSRSHQKAARMERGDRKRLGLTKNTGWLYRDFYGYKSRKKIKIKF